MIHRIGRGINHAFEHPFIATAGLAALVHSTWALGTLFSGPQPLPPELGQPLQEWMSFGVRTFAWHIVAFMIAFSFDVGQIVTSHEIRHAAERGEHVPRSKYITFLVFAMATYYLQWLYCAHHIPLLDLGAGVAENHVAFAKGLQSAAVWLIPAALPATTLFYTFSNGQRKEVQRQPPSIKIERPAVVQTPKPTEPPKRLAIVAPRNGPTGNRNGLATEAVSEENGQWIMRCPRCGKEQTYTSEASAIKGAAAHIGRYCKALVDA